MPLIALFQPSVDKWLECQLCNFEHWRLHPERSELFKAIEQLVEEDNWEQDFEARSALFLSARLVTDLDAWTKAPARSPLFVAASQAAWEGDVEDRSEALCAARLVVEVPPRPHAPAHPPPCSASSVLRRSSREGAKCICARYAEGGGRALAEHARTPTPPTLTTRALQDEAFCEAAERSELLVSARLAVAQDEVPHTSSSRMPLRLRACALPAWRGGAVARGGSRVCSHAGPHLASALECAALAFESLG
ncbi:hypothetical protein T484DRAFT_1831376 [Baffinella frigidus]|nr:hypothetical protein T484DRAFT_1831376 [Cryptophyta sp. CCMP2293]